MPNVIHIDQWLRRSEPDYYAMYINAWIPFNAWYVKEYNDTRDRACLEQICSTSNVYRNKIIALLSGVTPDAQRFRSYITTLHHELQRHSIPDEKPINFDNVLVQDNPTNVYQKDFSKYSFKWEYLRNSNPKCKCVVTHRTTHTTIVTIDLAKWDEAELLANHDYLGIGNEIVKRKVLEYFYLIKPKICIPIVVPPIGNGRKPQRCITIDDGCSLYFTENLDKISSAIVWMLYKLRCLIFHGNITPTTAHSSIYECAFYMQRMLIKELI